MLPTHNVHGFDGGTGCRGCHVVFTVSWNCLGHAVVGSNQRKLRHEPLTIFSGRSVEVLADCWPGGGSC